MSEDKELSQLLETTVDVLMGLAEKFGEPISRGLAAEIVSGIALGMAGHKTMANLAKEK